MVNVAEFSVHLMGQFYLSGLIDGSCSVNWVDNSAMTHTTVLLETYGMVLRNIWKVSKNSIN